jgi:hypothetical protein
MAIIRYKVRPITPVDAVMWNGENLAEVQTLCPEATKPGTGSMLSVPAANGTGFELYIGEYLMKNVAGGTYTKLSEDVFVGLYMPQPEIIQ